MMQANLPAICRKIYPRCDSRLPAIAGNSAWNCRFFACDCAGIFSCVCSYFCLRLAGIVTCDSSVFACKLHVFLPAEAGNFACYSRGQICMSSTCKITCKMHVIFRYIYMRLQAIRVYSARGACRLDAGKFTCFYR